MACLSTCKERSRVWEMIWRSVGRECHGKRGPSRSRRRVYLLGDGAWFLIPQHDKSSPNTAFKPNQANWRQGVAKTDTENSHLVIYIPAFHVVTRPTKPAEFTHIIQVPSDSLVTILETQTIWVQKYWFQLLIRSLWSFFFSKKSFPFYLFNHFFHFHSTELWIGRPG